MNLRTVLQYLTSLEQNNSRDWFHANKELYREAAGEFEGLVGALLGELRRTDRAIPPAEPGTLTFKLQRDTRFSHDKSPYNPSFRAHIGPRGKLPVPVGYYVMIRPGGRSFLGGGLFADMFRDATERVRGFLVQNGGEWEEILAAPAFAERFTVRGAALKKVPRGYDPGHPQADYLKYKSWYVEFPVPDQQLTAPDFIDNAVETFAAMQPFNAFLNRALEGFEMPQR